MPEKAEAIEFGDSEFMLFTDKEESARGPEGWAARDIVEVTKEGSQLGNTAVVVDPWWNGLLKVETKPRNPRHFDAIKGGRKRASDTSLIRNSV